MMDKVGKVFKYLEVVLFLIECGIVIEFESLVFKLVYFVYLEIVDFIKFIMLLKFFLDVIVLI